MALINCPDCGTEVSDAAAVCPKCARPIAPAGVPVRSTPSTPPTSKKGAGAGSVLLVILLVGGWVYYQTTVSSTSSPDVSSTQTSDTLPSGAGSPPSSAKDRPAFVTTPAELYQAYNTNEVATDQAIGKRVIQFTAPVKSIDKDFTDSAVLAFSTGEEFSDLRATLKDSDKGAAALLAPGEVVTVRCASVRRIMDSPMGDDCTFTASTGSEQPSTTSGGSVTPQSAAVEQPAVPAAAPADESPAAWTGTADGSSQGATDTDPAPQEGQSNASGPSFDCSAVTDATALTICSNDELSQLDRQMAALYVARAQSTDDMTVRDEQRTWLHDRNQCGADVICLRKEYAVRIQQLQQ